MATAETTAETKRSRTQQMIAERFQMLSDYCEVAGSHPFTCLQLARLDSEAVYECVEESSPRLRRRTNNPQVSLGAHSGCGCFWLVAEQLAMNSEICELRPSPLPTRCCLLMKRHATPVFGSVLPNVFQAVPQS